MATITTKTKEPTQKEMYTLIMTEMANNAKVVEFCEKKIAQLDAKTSKTSGKKNDKHDAFMGAIKAILYSASKPMTCGEIMAELNKNADLVETNEGKDFSTSLTSAMLRKLGDTGTQEVVKTTEKKVSYFALAD
jgi:hypothetical protein